MHILDDGMISVIVTKHVLGKEERRHPRQQDSQPLPKTPPATPCLFFVLSRLTRRTSSITCGPKNIDGFALTIRNCCCSSGGNISISSLLPTAME